MILCVGSASSPRHEIPFREVVILWPDVHEDCPTVSCCCTVLDSLGAGGCRRLLIGKEQSRDDGRHRRHEWRCRTEYRWIPRHRRWGRRVFKHPRRDRWRNDTKQWRKCWNWRHGKRWRGHRRGSWRRGGQCRWCGHRRKSRRPGRRCRGYRRSDRWHSSQYRRKCSNGWHGRKQRYR